MVLRTVGVMVVRQVLGLVGLGPRWMPKMWRSRCYATNWWSCAGRWPGPRYTPADRMVLAALANLLPRDRWPIFLITPSTLLRWQRAPELLARIAAGRHSAVHLENELHGKVLRSPTGQSSDRAAYYRSTHANSIAFR